ncbi:cupin domain-containing protein [Allonocardiopsis opalescens]|uniref:Cupin domain-containing protein n=1 Tax=Allonocardiopsis opalescens TaxID=1144618 RepID=A0A2T0QAI8_9ACTN|nr:cupin domain-containing protein [Allonocardiopsis opalescens]PRY00889.1 Cupin domain-containing protein [Allonocardiopsis opalescens]
MTTEPGLQYDLGAATGPTPGFPGGTAVSHLRVYDWPTSDGLAGGSPHLHTASAEGYVVLQGSGALETLSAAGFHSTPLSAGTLLWFTPGTVHRLVNHSGDLELVVVMQNAGLPEAGDAVLTYPQHVLADAEAYRAATALPSAADFANAADADDAMAAAARRRRDLAIEGYLALRERVVSEGPQALAELHEAAVRLVTAKAAGWRHPWRSGPLAQAETTGRHLDDLASGHAPHLSDATVYTAQRPQGLRRHGMCGRLQVWDLDGAQPLT